MRTGIVVVLLGVLGAGRAHAQPGGPATAPPAQPSQPVPPAGTPPAGAPPPVAPATPPANYPPPPPANYPPPPPTYPPPAYYPPPPPRSMYVQQPVPLERQRRGLILLGDLGFAGHSSGRNGGTVSGGGLNVRGAIGVMATPHLALYLGASYFESTSVTIEQGGTKVDTDQLTLSATSFFLGGRIYTTSSFYFDGTLGTLKQTGKDESTGFSAASDTGVIGAIGFGKEWWLQSGLGVGLGARLGIGSVPAQDGGDDPVVAHFDFCFNLSWSGS